jgi:hypothetical protein
LRDAYGNFITLDTLRARLEAPEEPPPDYEPGEHFREALQQATAQIARAVGVPAEMAGGPDLANYASALALDYLMGNTERRAERFETMLLGHWSHDVVNTDRHAGLLDNAHTANIGADWSHDAGSIIDNLRAVRDRMEQELSLPIGREPAFLLPLDYQARACGLLPPEIADLTRWPEAVAILRYWSSHPWDPRHGLILADWLEEHVPGDLGERVRAWAIQKADFLPDPPWGTMTRTMRRTVIQNVRSILKVAFGDFMREEKNVPA